MEIKHPEYYKLNSERNLTYPMSYNIGEKKSKSIKMAKTKLILDELREEKEAIEKNIKKVSIGNLMQKLGSCIKKKVDFAQKSFE